MPGIDQLISKSLSAVIKNNLDDDVGKKIKMSLFKNYGLSINQAINDFSKLDEVLGQFLNSDASIFEKKCLMDILTIKKLNDSAIVTIKEKNLVTTFLEILGDAEYLKIIKSTLLKPLLISEIIQQCNLPKTSGYRKINSLIRKGILLEVERELTTKRRTVERYSPIFKNFVFEINKNHSLVNLTVPQEKLEISSSLQIIQKGH